MNSLRYAASIGLGLAGLTFAAVVCVGSSGAVEWSPVEVNPDGWHSVWNGPVIRFAALVAGACLVTHTLCLWRMLGQLKTALRGSTQRAQSMIDALSDGVLILDTSDRIVLANQTLAQWTGRPAFALAGLPAEVLAWRSTENEALESLPWRRSAIAGDAPVELEAALADGQGNLRPVRLNARPITTDDAVTPARRSACKLREGTLVVLRPAFDPARLPRVGDIALALRQARTADADLESLLKLSNELVATCQAVLAERAEAGAPSPPLVVDAN